MDDPYGDERSRGHGLPWTEGGGGASRPAPDSSGVDDSEPYQGVEYVALDALVGEYPPVVIRWLARHADLSGHGKRPVFELDRLHDLLQMPDCPVCFCPLAR